MSRKFEPLDWVMKAQREAFLAPSASIASRGNVKTQFQPGFSKDRRGATVSYGGDSPHPHKTDCISRRGSSGSGKRTADVSSLSPAHEEGLRKTRVRGEPRGLCINSVKALLNIDGNPCKFFNTKKGCRFDHFVVKSPGNWSAKEIASLSEKVRALSGETCLDKHLLLEKINTLHATV